jgi:hypothetical protein
VVVAQCHINLRSRVTVHPRLNNKPYNVIKGHVDKITKSSLLLKVANSDNSTGSVTDCSLSVSCFLGFFYLVGSASNSLFFKRWREMIARTNSLLA